MGLNKNTAPNANFLTVKHSAICRELKPTPVTEQEIAQALADGYEEKTVKDPSRKNADGTDFYMTKYVQLFGSLNGRIKNIEWYDSKDTYKTRFMGIKIKIKDARETFILDLAYGTKAYDVFTRVMENIDYTRDVSFAAWHDKREDKTAFVIRQDEQTVKWRYTRDYNQQVLASLRQRPELRGLADAFQECVVDAGDAAFMSAALRKELSDNGFIVAPLPVKNELDKWNFDEQKAFLFTRLRDIVIPKVKELNPDFDEPVPDETDDAPEATTSPEELDAFAPGAAEQAAAQSPTPAGTPATENAQAPSPIQQAQQQVAQERAAAAVAPAPEPVAAAGPGGLKPPYGVDDDIPF